MCYGGPSEGSNFKVIDYITTLIKKDDLEQELQI